MEYPPPPAVLLHPAPTSAFLARRCGKSSLTIALGSTEIHQSSKDNDSLVEGVHPRNSHSASKKYVVGNGAALDSAHDSRESAMDLDLNTSPAEEASATTLLYGSFEDTKQAGLTFGQKRCSANNSSPAKRLKLDENAHVAGGSRSNVSHVTRGADMQCTPTVVKHVSDRVSEWTRGLVCTPPPALDSAFGEFPFSALSTFSDKSGVERSSPSLSQDSSTSVQVVPSPESALPEYFANTNLPREGWLQICRCCSQWTGATIDVQEDEIPCCRRCQQRFHRLKSTPKGIEGKRDPLSCYVAKTLDEAGISGYPCEEDMPAVLEKAILDLDVVWSEYLAE
jgi:hypothetical protein